MGRFVTISAEGDVFPCPERASPFFKKDFSYGNIHNDKISELWHSKKHYNLFKKINPNKKKCLCCPINDKFNNICSKYYK